MSYNVFADMGFENPEEELLKSEIISELRSLIDTKQMTTQQVAERWHLEPSLLPEIFCGGWGDYSVERLLQFATALGGTVRVTIECYGESPDVALNSHDTAPAEEAKTLVLTA
jgi:predicted XRE-type DNA-binding protein